MMSAATAESSRRIMIVEDDETTAEMLTEILQTSGYQPVIVESGQHALSTLESEDTDLVLLDMNLPDMSGLEVVRQVRTASLTPLIALSGLTREGDKVAALEMGADDYLDKPFSPEELVARINALLRRVGWAPSMEPKLRIRQLELDLARRQAHLNTRKLHLTPVEYGILVTLMRNAGKVVAHDDLLRSVWGTNYEGDYSVLRVNISRLRQKLEDKPRFPTYIVTAPGQGYYMPA
ncbi:MAG: response regulator transcription factor [Anaerolineae bacterium]|nr:response regulator transcription factor [Anaerolineae bacterium]NUQ05695.1 response regulator transcription factor [Anaerolineae bacterium]